MFITGNPTDLIAAKVITNAPFEHIYKPGVEPQDVIQSKDLDGSNTDPVEAMSYAVTLLVLRAGKIIAERINQGEQSLRCLFAGCRSTQ